MSYISKIWYVAAWSSEVTPEKPVARNVIGEPIVLWRNAEGAIQAMEDRCPHRFAPLSLGRVEGDQIRCMYHGLRFDGSGKCTHVPPSDQDYPALNVRVLPTCEKDGWIWVWPGDPALADPGLAPDAWGDGAEDFALQCGSLDYNADYQLINDNLSDLSHVDYVHETTLGAATGNAWSKTFPTVRTLPDGILVERWLPPVQIDQVGGLQFENFNSYRYLLPGIFLMRSEGYMPGTAEQCGNGRPTQPPLWVRVEQQAITPIGPGRSRYHFATGVPRAHAEQAESDAFFRVAQAAFEEDRTMIEGQQRILDQTAADRDYGFIPQDKGPAIIRRLISARLRKEAGE
ncbi:aromatic ring-hydroxylating dioxygenase subunit alpha [Novosphingobium sp.]|uniref:aromatic ring-hydroxylating dioxygenase subunit alpha n=1 Tax=Novosphingobium sp. TaxID=1874826 RepID=UPI001E1A229D|nr:aromatic ring-hydroxylating dioxygenase subunit alpha [Novosphingobium sp.]MBX9662650.1 aromatic ring-hydroxylating dioxygenase subunit alpha [Novosphingobium sp.]